MAVPQSWLVRMGTEILWHNSAQSKYVSNKDITIYMTAALYIVVLQFSDKLQIPVGVHSEMKDVLRLPQNIQNNVEVICSVHLTEQTDHSRPSVLDKLY